MTLASKPSFKRLALWAITSSLLAGAGYIGTAQAQSDTTQGIFTCTDARGRKLTADRPIADCFDREQQILNPSGSLKARVGPTLTPKERAAVEAKNKAELEESSRIMEEKRRERSLLIRYPNKSLHDKERAAALSQVAAIRQEAIVRTQELTYQRNDLDKEMEFYKKDASKAPHKISRQIEEVVQSLAVQSRFIADQDTEEKRVNARFDEELLRLKRLWALQSPVPPTAPSKAN